jgi:CCR4-NOT transcription complex subunit 6
VTIENQLDTILQNMLTFFAAAGPYRACSSLVSRSIDSLSKVKMASRSAQKRKRRHAASLTARQEQPKEVSAPKQVNRSWKNAVLPQYEFHAQVTESPASITFMTYNVLAQAYVSGKIFPDTPHAILRSKHRRSALLNDLRSFTETYSIDVMCLQELEQDTCTMIARDLKEFGAYAYKLRTSAGARDKRDGSGIFWRKARFESVHDVDDWHLELNDIADDTRLSSLLEPKSVAIRDCVSAMVCLRDLETGHRFVITSSHLFWDPCFARIKLAQAFGVREAAWKLADNSATRNVILAGDWNSTPNSSVFALLEKGQISGTYADCSDLSDAQVAAVNQGPRNKLRSVHKYDVSSFREGSSLQHDEGSLPLTTFTRKFKGALDHIFLSMGSTGENAVLGTLSLPAEEDFVEKEIVALPSEGHPSDHLPVVARISLALDSTTSLCEEPVGGRISSIVDEGSLEEQSLMTRVRDLCNIS